MHRHVLETGIVRGAFAALAFGAMLATPASAVTLTTLHSFNVTDGSLPQGRLIADSNGNLYGTTTRGGVGNVGTVFSLGADGSGFTTLHSFVGSDGNEVEAGLVADSAGNLYGTTFRGGTFDEGAVFRLGADGSGFTTLHSFNNTDGSRARAELIIDSAGNLYGTTSRGGASNLGTVFRLGTDGSGFTTLRSLDGLNGSTPRAGLVADADGNLYGAGEAGGTFNDGAVFRLGTDGSGFGLLHSFDSADGRSPAGTLLADSAGNLFGTTRVGGAFGLGTVFTLGTDGSGFTTLHNFAGTDGSQPFAGLIADAAGNLYGTTSRGGAFDRGTVFRIGKDGSSFESLYSFVGAFGGQPLAELIADSAGNLYGTTAGGGAFGWGTVFKLSDTGFVVDSGVIPEPASWAMMITGFGIVGCAMRRRATRPVSARGA